MGVIGIDTAYLPLGKPNSHWFRKLNFSFDLEKEFWSRMSCVPFSTKPKWTLASYPPFKRMGLFHREQLCTDTQLASKCTSILPNVHKSEHLSTLPIYYLGTLECKEKNPIFIIWLLKYTKNREGFCQRLFLNKSRIKRPLCAAARISDFFSKLRCQRFMDVWFLARYLSPFRVHMTSWRKRLTNIDLI